MKRILDWVAEHDNKKLFIVLYIGLSLVLSIAISLFWLLFAVFVHFLFELIGQQKQHNNWCKIFLESLWETKLDFALVIFAFWLAIYLDFIFGVVGIGALARVGAQTASRVGSVSGKAAEVSVRFAAWTRIIRGFMLSIDDIGNTAKAIYQGKKANKRKQPEELAEVPREHAAITLELSNYTDSKSSWTGKWSVIDYIGIGIFILCAVSILIAPWIININYNEIIRIGLTEFHPFPS